MCRKVFVDVNANFKADGTIIPLSIKWEDGTVYRIDQVGIIAPWLKVYFLLLYSPRIL